MEGLREILKLPPILRQIDYNCDKPIVITIDISPIATGWPFHHNDIEGRRFAIRFGARIYTNRQKRYSQVNREFLGAVTTIKAYRYYLIGPNVVQETNCLPLLGMIAKCFILDIICQGGLPTLNHPNLVLIHVSGKKNYVADMLSRVIFNCEAKM